MDVKIFGDNFDWWNGLVIPVSSWIIGAIVTAKATIWTIEKTIRVEKSRDAEHWRLQLEREATVKSEEEKKTNEFKDKLIESLIVEINAIKKFCYETQNILTGVPYVLETQIIDSSAYEQMKLFKNSNLLIQMMELRNRTKIMHLFLTKLSEFKYGDQTHDANIFKSNWNIHAGWGINQTDVIKNLLILEGTPELQARLNPKP